MCRLCTKEGKRSRQETKKIVLSVGTGVQRHQISYSLLLFGENFKLVNRKLKIIFWVRHRDRVCIRGNFNFKTEEVEDTLDVSDNNLNTFRNR